MIPIHDNLFRRYSVDGESKTIVLHTEPCEDGEPFVDVIFTGVVAYQFEGDALSNILFGIEQATPSDYNDVGKLLAEQHRLYGVMPRWDMASETLEQFCESNRVKLFNIHSSYGLGGWIIAANEVRTAMKIDDRVYREVDDSCGLCGHRGIEALTIHHIDGDRSNNSYENQIVLCHNCHQRHHNGKGITDAHIRRRKSHLIAKSLTPYGLNALKIAARTPVGVTGSPYLLMHLVDLGYLTKQETLSTYGNDKSEVEVDAVFAITERGRMVLDTWLKTS